MFKDLESCDSRLVISKTEETGMRLLGEYYKFHQRLAESFDHASGCQQAHEEYFDAKLHIVLFARDLAMFATGKEIKFIRQQNYPDEGHLVFLGNCPASLGECYLVHKKLDKCMEATSEEKEQLIKEIISAVTNWEIAFIDSE